MDIEKYVDFYEFNLRYTSVKCNNQSYRFIKNIESYEIIKESFGTELQLITYASDFTKITKQFNDDIVLRNNTFYDLTGVETIFIVLNHSLRKDFNFPNFSTSQILIIEETIKNMTARHNNFKYNFNTNQQPSNNSNNNNNSHLLEMLITEESIH